MRFFLLISYAIISIVTKGQDTQIARVPVIGKPFPNYLFRDIDNHSSDSFTTNDAKGKWLILDFWNEFCSECISNFPEIQNINDAYGDKVKIVAVAYTGSMKPGQSSFGSIRQLVKKINKKYNFTFSVAYDSVLYKNYNIPCYAIVDPSGVLRYLTTNLKSSSIKNILNEDFSELVKIAESKSPQNSIEENRKNNYNSSLIMQKLFLLHKRGEDVFVRNETNNSSKIQHFEISGYSLEYFYRFAYVGVLEWNSDRHSFYSDFWHYPILKIVDSSFFHTEKKYRFLLSTIGNLSHHDLMLSLQNTLKEVFGYTVTIDTVFSPYWSVQLVDSSFISKLRSSGGLRFAKLEGKFGGFRFHNVPMSQVLNNLWGNFDLISSRKGAGRPFIDETGLAFNIDLEIDVYTLDFDEYRRALLEKGLKLVEKSKPMRAIVISDYK